jgi:hypothetical protein
MGMSKVAICSSIIDGNCESVEACITWMDENAVRLSDIETKVALAMSELPMADRDGPFVAEEENANPIPKRVEMDDPDGGDDGWFDDDVDMDMDMDKGMDMDAVVDDAKEMQSVSKEEKNEEEGVMEEKESVEEKAIRLAERAKAERKAKEEQEAKEVEVQRRLVGKEAVSARVYYKQKERERHRMEVQDERRRKKKEREILLGKIEADRLERHRKEEEVSGSVAPVGVSVAAKPVARGPTSSTAAAATECNIVLQAPDGRRSREQLPLKATIRDVLHRAASVLPGVRFKLVCGYPKQTYQVGCPEESQTLQSLGLERSLFHVQKYEGLPTFHAGYHGERFDDDDEDDNSYALPY